MLILTFLILKFFFPEMAMTGKAKGTVLSGAILSEWSCTKNNNGVALFERWIKIDNALSVRERKGEFVSNCSFTNAKSYLNQIHTLKKWMNSVTKVIELPNNGSNETRFYIVFDLPWPFSNRDVVAKCTTYSFDENKCIVKFIGINNHHSLNKDYKHIQNYQVTWTIEKLTSTQTKITLNTFSEEPAMFPLWVQDPVLNKVFYNNLQRLKRQLAKF